MTTEKLIIETMKAEGVEFDEHEARNVIFEGRIRFMVPVHKFISSAIIKRLVKIPGVKKISITVSGPRLYFLLD